MKSRVGLLVGGIILMLVAGFSILGLVVSALVPDFSNRTLGVIIYGVCSVIFTVPAAILLWLWHRGNVEDKMVEVAASMLRTRKEARLDDVADFLKVDETKAESLIHHALARGEVVGYWDPDHRKFIGGQTPWGSPPSAGGPPTLAPPGTQYVAVAPSAPIQGPASGVRYCRECGNQVAYVDASGVWKCPACGNEQ